MKNLSQKDEDVLSKLLLQSYAAEHTRHQITSRRNVVPDSHWDLEHFKGLLKTSQMFKVNPFHVIRVEFAVKEISEHPPGSKSLFVSSRKVLYQELSYGWKTSLIDLLINEWKSLVYCLESFAFSLGVDKCSATHILIGQGGLSPLFAYAMLYTNGESLPVNLHNEAIRLFCLSPKANKAAAYEVDLLIPKSIAKYGKTISKIE